MNPMRIWPKIVFRKKEKLIDNCLWIKFKFVLYPEVCILTWNVLSLEFKPKGSERTIWALYELTVKTLSPAILTSHVYPVETFEITFNLLGNANSCNFSKLLIYCSNNIQNYYITGEIYGLIYFLICSI